MQILKELHARIDSLEWELDHLELDEDSALIKAEIKELEAALASVQKEIDYGFATPKFFPRW